MSGILDLLREGRASRRHDGLAAVITGEIIVDLFAGGGGASAGIAAALGRGPDIAVNHDATAIAVHAANHATTNHACASVWNVEPRAACAGRPVGLLWASPDCRHFSRAAGGRPKWKSVRSLPGVVLTWAARVRPRVIVVENVREFLGWGPLLDDGTPCPDRIGRSFDAWVGRLRGLGYRVQWRELCAADYGAPIAWPAPTHQHGGGLLGRPWRGAAEIIDWSLPCRSIFTRPRPLAEATLRRIALGVQRFVLGDAQPFIIPVTHSGGSSNRARPVAQPLPTITAGGEHHALVAAFLAQHNGGAVGCRARRPLTTITTTATQQQLVTASLSAGDRTGPARTAGHRHHHRTLRPGAGGRPADRRHRHAHAGLARARRGAGLSFDLRARSHGRRPAEQAGHHAADREQRVPGGGRSCRVGEPERRPCRGLPGGLKQHARASRDLPWRASAGQPRHPGRGRLPFRPSPEGRHPWRARVEHALNEPAPRRSFVPCPPLLLPIPSLNTPGECSDRGGNFYAHDYAVFSHAARAPVEGACAYRGCV